MTEMTESGDYYNSNYYRHPLEQYQAAKASRTLTTKLYLNKLIKLQTIGTLVLFSSIILQGIAIGTSDWFVLNVNEYVQSAKGGLWYYCYITSAGTLGKLDCFTYEKLPNFFVFANDRLFDSRVLFLCSSGFLFIILITEIAGIISLKRIERKGKDPFDSFVAQRSRKFRFDDEYDDGQLRSSGSVLRDYRSSMSMQQGGGNTSDDGQMTKKRTSKPIGYFAFLTFVILSLIGSGLELVLKVSAFALFDSYINKLLSFNRVFMAYRSWSFWLMAGSILFVVLYWIFKLVSTRYVLTLTKELQNAHKVNQIFKDNELIRKSMMMPVPARFHEIMTDSSYPVPMTNTLTTVSQLPRTSRFLVPNLVMQNNERDFAPYDSEVITHNIQFNQPKRSMLVQPDPYRFNKARTQSHFFNETENTPQQQEQQQQQPYGNTSPIPEIIMRSHSNNLSRVEFESVLHHNPSILSSGSEQRF